MDRMPETALMSSPGLWHLMQRVHAVSGVAELRFLLLNETRNVFDYRQAALVDDEQGLLALSGVARADRHTPYAVWLEAVSAAVPRMPAVCRLHASALPVQLAADWVKWWPEHAVLLQNDSGQRAFFASEQSCSDDDLSQLSHWWTVWTRHAELLRTRDTQSWRLSLQSIKAAFQPLENQPWWRNRRNQLIGAVLALCLLPVRLSVLAPGELVPVNPVWVRSPIEGVIDTFHVQPNQTVSKGAPLLGFDEILIQSRLDVARQTLATAEAEYRQASQLALGDNRYKSQMSLLVGKIEEKRTEAEFLAGQLERARLSAPADGIVLMDDPGEWIGKPVVVGERILRIAKPGESEVEAWLPIGDAIGLEPGHTLSLHLNASPLSPVQATLRYMAHDAVQRPDGQFAYRVRATLSEPTDHRIGLKGTAKLNGDRVPLIYWVMRRPLASMRSALGI